MIKSLLKSIGIASLFFGQAAQAQIPVTDAANIIEQVLQYAEQIMQYEQQIQQYEEQVKAATSLGQKLGGALNTDQSTDISNIQTATQAATGVNGLVGTASNLRQKVQDTYGSNDSSTPAPFKKYMGATDDTIRGAMSNNASSLDGMSAEASRLNSLVSQSNNASGQLQATQAGNQITAELASQIQKQRQQQAIQANADNAAALAQQRQAESKAAVTRYFLGISRNP